MANTPPVTAFLNLGFVPEELLAQSTWKCFAECWNLLWPVCYTQCVLIRSLHDSASWMWFACCQYEVVCVLSFFTVCDFWAGLCMALTRCWPKIYDSNNFHTCLDARAGFVAHPFESVCCEDFVLLPRDVCQSSWLGLASLLGLPIALVLRGVQTCPHLLLGWPRYQMWLGGCFQMLSWSWSRCGHDYTELHQVRSTHHHVSTSTWCKS